MQQTHALDNAMAEAWVATFKAEAIQGRTLQGVADAEHEALGFIGFDNSERLHEALGYLSPARYEAGERREGRPFGPRRPDQPALAGGAGRTGNNGKTR